MGDFSSGLHRQLLELLGGEGVRNCLFEQLFDLFDEIGGQSSWGRIRKVRALD